jgi:hypothetical protein
MRAILGGILTLGVVFSLAEIVKADDRAEAMAIVNKAITAAGGAEKLAKVKGQTWKEEGTFYGMGEGVPFTSNCAVQFPDRMKMEIEGFFAIVLDGDKAWIKFGEDTNELTGDQLKEQREAHYAGWVASLLPLSDKAFQLKPLGESKVGEKPAKGVQVSRDGHRDVKLYFDAKSSLLAKSEYNVVTMEQPGQEVLREVFFDDFQEIGGVRLPTTIAIKQDGKKFVEAKISELKTSEKLDDDLFAKP